MAKSRPLTEDFILAKTKADSLKNVKNLNMWGVGFDDLSIISRMPELEVVCLSVNKIHTLKDFVGCSELQVAVLITQELYLRKNNIADINEVKYLASLQKLKVLWLQDNPCTNVDNYRMLILKMLPKLVKLDNDEVTKEQREHAAAMEITHNIVQMAAQHPKKQEMTQVKPIVKQESIASAVKILLKDLDMCSLDTVRKQIERLLHIH